MKFRLNLILNDGISPLGDKHSQPIINITIVHFIVVTIVALIVFFFPFIWLLVLMPLTIVSLVLGFGPQYLQPYFPNSNIVLPIITLLKETRLLDFFTTLHSLVFYTITKVYLYFFIFCYGSTICYMLVSRYTFYHKVVLHEAFSFKTSVIVGSILLISCCGSYLRTLINLSNIIVYTTRRYAPELLDPLLRVEPADLPPGSNRSIFNFSKNTHNHYHYPPTPKTNNWGRFGFFVAVGGFMVSAATYEHTRRQTLEAQRQTLEAQKQTAEAQRQTYEFKRQNDLEELSQNIITKEEYNKRHPKS